MAKAATAPLLGAATGPARQPTRPMSPPHGTPRGRPDVLSRNDKASENERGSRLENASARVLADQGYDVYQKPNKQAVQDAAAASGDTISGTVNPDYLIEGRVFDNFAPAAAKSVRSIWSSVEEKVNRGQTQRVIVNLGDWEGEPQALMDQFSAWEIGKLQELKLILRDDTVISWSGNQNGWTI